MSPAVASNRIKDLETRFGVRLLNRTTRKLVPTEVGRAFYDNARRVIETLDEAEAVVSGFSGMPHGALRVTAPLGLGRRLIAPLVPKFCDEYPGVELRLRLSDRNVDIIADGIDLAFFLGEPQGFCAEMKPHRRVPAGAGGDARLSGAAWHARAPRGSDRA